MECWVVDMKKKNLFNHRLFFGIFAAVLMCSTGAVRANDPTETDSTKPAGEAAEEGVGEVAKGDAGEPVNTYSGNSYFSEQDVALSAVGVPLDLNRTYNSLRTYESPFGPGWSSSFDWMLSEVREQTCSVSAPTNGASSGYKVVLWEGTEVISSSGSSCIITPGRILGTRKYYTNQTAVVIQSTTTSTVDLQPVSDSLEIGSELIDPITEIRDLSDNVLSMPDVDIGEISILKLYTGNGGVTDFYDEDLSGTYYAVDKNWFITTEDDQWVVHLPGGKCRIFSSTGQMMRHEDGWGRGISFSYDDDGRLSMVTHDNGLTADLVYSDNSSGESDLIVPQETVPLNRVFGINITPQLYTRYHYTTNGLLDLRVIHANGQTFTNQFQYADGIMTQRVNAVGHVYAYEYETDSDGALTGKNIAMSIDGKWFNHSVTYTTENILTDFSTEARGVTRLHRYAYSSTTGYLTDHLGPGTDESDAETRGISYDYNDDGDISEETQFDDSNALAQDFCTYTDYDDTHNPTSVSVLFGSGTAQPIFSAQWDSDALLPSSSSDGDDGQTDISYINGSPSLIQRTISDSQTADTTYTYYPNGLLAKMANANDHEISFTYDSRGYTDTVYPAQGPALKTEYDSLGFLESIDMLTEDTCASSGRTTLYDTTARGWVQSITYPDGLTQSFQYNRLGDVTNIVDRAGRSTDLTYSPESRVTSVTQYLEENGSTIPVQIGYDFDDQFNTLSITEPRGRYVESYQLDIQDRVTSVTNIEGQAMSITYGLGDFVSSVTRFDGSSISNTYDSVGWPSVITYLSASNVPLSTISRTYYADSLPKIVSDDTTSVANTYDRLNRLTGVSTSNSVYSVVNYSHDPVGNLTNSVVNIGGSSSVATAYSYDEGERLTGISQTIDAVSSPRSFSYSYSPVNGRISSVTNSESGIVTAYQYDILDHVTNLTYKTASGSLIRGLNYQYDALGMITNIVTSNDSSQLSVTAYQYDTLNRLTGETRTAGILPASSTFTEYNYDLAGNRTSVVSDGTTNTYTLGTGNRLDFTTTEYTDHTETNSYAYDAAGCLTNSAIGNQQSAISLTWDERYRLTEVQLSTSNIPQSTVSYSYDVLGRKVSRTAGFQPAEVEQYVYSGNQIAADLDENGDLLRAYTWGPGIDNLLALTVYGSDSSDPTTYYALKDHQNSVLAFTDASGTLIETYDYDAWGQVTVYDGSGNELTTDLGLPTSGIGNRYTFQGREIDWTTGLTYFRARWYDPATGRWLSKDPIGISGGLNLYAFCGNNPVNFIDPLGLIKLDDFSTEDLEATSDSITIGRDLWMEVATTGSGDAIREATESGSVEHANPFSGSDNPIIHRFERDAGEIGLGLYSKFCLYTAAGVNGDMTLMNAVGMSEVYRHQRMIDQINSELAGRENDCDKE
jgi:RHS repeat-associated protein